MKQATFRFIGILLGSTIFFSKNVIANEVQTTPRLNSVLAAMQTEFSAQLASRDKVLFENQKMLEQIKKELDMLHIKGKENGALQIADGLNRSTAE